VGDAGLDDIPGLEMAGQTPNRSHQRGIAIIPAFEAQGASPYTLSLQSFYHFGPQGPELRAHLARVRAAKQTMQALLPIGVRLV